MIIWTTQQKKALLRAALILKEISNIIPNIWFNDHKAKRFSVGCRNSRPCLTFFISEQNRDLKYEITLQETNLYLVTIYTETNVIISTKTTPFVKLGVTIMKAV